MLIDTHCHLYDDKFENAKEIIDNNFKVEVKDEEMPVCESK